MQNRWALSHLKGWLIITKDIETLMKDHLKAERTVLGAELCCISVNSSLPLDELPGPSKLQSTQSTESTHLTSSDMQKATEKCSSASTAKLSDACCFKKLHNLSAIVEKVSESGFQKWTIELYFDEIAENYIQARVPVLSGNQSSLEEWEKSLNGLTQLKKFSQSGTLMYGDPTQGPSIVSSIDFDNVVGGVKVYEYYSVITWPVSVHYLVQDLSCANRIRILLLASLCQQSEDAAEMLQMLCTIKCYCRVSFKCNIRFPNCCNYKLESSTKRTPSQIVYSSKGSMVLITRIRCM